MSDQAPAQPEEDKPEPNLTPNMGPAPESAVAAAPPYASLGDRLIAQLVDGLVAFGLFFLVGSLLAPLFGGTTDSGFNLEGLPALAVMLIVFLLVLAYFVGAESLVGATLGKLTSGIRVQTLTGERISGRAALIRNLMRFVDGIGLYLVGGICVLVTKRNQRLGDLAAGTVVVRQERAKALRIGALIVALLVAVGGVVGGFVLPPATSGPASLLQTGTPRYATTVITDDRTTRVQKAVFPPNTRQIFVLFTLADVPAGTALKSVWIAENVQGLAPNTRIDEAELRGGGPLNEGNFSFTPPPDGWPVGSYRVELYVGGQLARTERFRVQ